MDRWEVPESDAAEQAARIDDPELDQEQRGDDPEPASSTGERREPAPEFAFEADSADAYDQTVEVPDDDSEYRDQ